MGERTCSETAGSKQDTQDEHTNVFGGLLSQMGGKARNCPSPLAARLWFLESIARPIAAGVRLCGFHGWAESSFAGRRDPTGPQTPGLVGVVGKSRSKPIPSLAALGNDPRGIGGEPPGCTGMETPWAMEWPP